MDSTFGIVFGALFISNIVLSQFLGLCSFLGVSKNMRNALGMSAAVAFVMIMASTISWFLYHSFLLPFGLAYLKTIVFILAIASLVQLLEMFMKKHSPGLHKAMGVFLPLITTNCAILGIALINVQKEYSLFDATVNSVSTALGYTLALVVFSCIRERLDEADLPESMKNLPIALITASCMSISLLGLSGMH
ncbi:MAG: RnfABCDGE type electron transport complex subunit A [Acholeplasmataceae bacterium]|jgi:electron transport complex protein RnfA|nr:RnfABCDGE type electron transport complex subunit A [Acidaminococcaceae bacterium]NLY84612.1 RnfABCDGE type electron transport complex subunit A [Acholeplasmataceae bacterium]